MYNSLREVDSIEVNSKFRHHKLKSLELSESFGRLGFTTRSEKVESCGTYLSFTHSDDGYGNFSSSGRLTYANFCKDRLCPMCMWRRSIKVFLQVSRCMDVLQGGYYFAMLSLTVPNIKGDELEAKIRDMSKAFDRFLKKKWPHRLIRGYFKSLEITYNDDKTSPSYDTFHPHIHVLLALPKSYAKKIYFDEDAWLEWWREAARDPTIEIVDIEAVYYKTAAGKVIKQSSFKHSVEYKAAVCECTKYTLKSSEYLKPNKALTDHIVSYLATQLDHLRFISFGGCFAKARREIGADDVESGDLINLDPVADVLPPSFWKIVNEFSWRIGAYVLSDTDKFIDRKKSRAELHSGYEHDD